MDNKNDNYELAKHHLFMTFQEYTFLVMQLTKDDNTSQDIVDSLNNIGREILFLSDRIEELKKDSVKEEPKKCTYRENNDIEPTCTHECDGCGWYV